MSDKKAKVKKVYCGTCRFLTHDCKECDHPTNIYKFDTWEKKSSGYHSNPEDINRKNSCEKHEPRPSAPPEPQEPELPSRNDD